MKKRKSFSFEVRGEIQTPKSPFSRLVSMTTTASITSHAQEMNVVLFFFFSRRCCTWATVMCRWLLNSGLGPYRRPTRQYWIGDCKPWKAGMADVTAITRHAYNVSYTRSESKRCDIIFLRVVFSLSQCIVFLSLFFFFRSILTEKKIDNTICITILKRVHNARVI